jgi:hypothetical protein
MLAVGCGSGNELGRVPVSGLVLVDGQPLAAGTIEFSPQSATGQSSGAVIHVGKFSIPLAQGLPPGKYTVRVYSPASGAPLEDGPPGPLGPSAVKDGIPAKYNAESQEVLEVTGAGPVNYELEIRTQS